MDSLLQLLAHQFYQAAQLNLRLKSLADLRTHIEDKFLSALVADAQPAMLHNVFAPLQNLELSVEIIRRRLHQGEYKVILEHLTQIQASAVEAALSARGFLLFAQNRKLGPIPVSRPAEPDWVHVPSSFEDVVEKLGTLALKSGKTLLFRTTRPDAPKRLSQPDRFPLLEGEFEEVLSNLIHNAIKYSDSGTKVKITLYHQGVYVILDVTSYGIAIREDETERIFELGYRTVEAKRIQFNAVGLGLYHARSIAAASGAELFLVTSEYTGPSSRGAQYRNTFRLRSKL